MTVDGNGKLRTFSLDDIETTNREIVSATSQVDVLNGPAFATDSNELASNGGGGNGTIFWKARDRKRYCKNAS